MFGLGYFGFHLEDIRHPLEVKMIGMVEVAWKLAGFTGEGPSRIDRDMLSVIVAALEEPGDLLEFWAHLAFDIQPNEAARTLVRIYPRP